MKIALVTTTINVPTVLKLYRKCSEEVMFFVTGDRKTPDEEVVKLLEQCGPHAYYGIDYQHKLGYACSQLLGENTIGRRSIAILEALKWGADIIVSVDDDNFPLSTDYFDRFEMALTYPFHGLQVSGSNGWFDPGCLLSPPVVHRGFPFEKRGSWQGQSIADVRVGVAAGVCLGNPDVSAIERIANQPSVLGMSELARAGVVVDNKTWSVANSQNIAFVRELAPCFLLPPQWLRFDDILASLVVQRVMREFDMRLHTGQPAVFQERNEHDLYKDLQQEMFGMKHVVEFAGWLNGFEFTAAQSILDMVSGIYEAMTDLKWMSAGVCELGAAWAKDCESVL